MLEPGSLVGGDYRVERKLSSGGMGAVFIAEQVSTGARRALKIIRPELLSQPKLRQRFAQEAKVTSKIASDHVVSVVAAGIDAELGVPWIAMELLEGQTLHGLILDRGALPADMALAILQQLAHAIDAAHAAGVVHRDLKPENVFLSESRRTGFPFLVKVLDFGIARMVREAQATRTDSLGTPMWMAPEQASTGEEIGPWTDMWSLGLIAFYLLTGRSYWLSAQGEVTTLGLVREVCIDPLPPARERARAVGFEGELPSAFDAWFAGCVCREIGGRFASAGVAIASLRSSLGAARIELALEATGDMAHARTELGFPATARSRIDEGVSSKGHEPVVEIARPIVTPSSAVSVTKAEPAAQARPRWRRVVALGVALGALLGVTIGVRAHRLGASVARDSETCRAAGKDEACRRACAHGDAPACARAAMRGLASRDDAEVSRSVAVLREACSRGAGEACGALGRASSFPVGRGMTRDPKLAVELLEKSCGAGHACALLGALKELGWSGIAKDASSYFATACAAPPATAEATLDCAWAVAHEFEGPPGGVVSARLASAAGLPLLASCAEHGGDLCGLAWLDRGGQPGDVLAAYEKGCEGGSALACNNLGAMRAEGAAGLQPNPAAARETFERACAAGEPAACNNLAFVLGGLPATVRRGPRGATLYKLRCSGALQVGCAGWGARVEVVPKGTPVSLEDAAAALRRACEAGLTTACVSLGAFLYVGRGAPRDRAGAERLFADSCFRGDASACGEQGSALLTLRMDHPRDARAGIGFLERACKGGEKDSCMSLYGHMVNGLPDHKREAEGLLGLQGLAAQKLHGHALAQLYETGAEGLPRDPEKARRLAIQECEEDLRCADAAYYLSRGIGGAKDERRALEALDRGCEADDFPSCGELGARYREGRSVGRDPTRAVEFFTKACNGADADACNELSLAYATADGVPRDAVRALSLAKAACDSGGAPGCATVGVMIAEGAGTKKDIDAAAPYLGFGCRRAVQAACEKLQALKKPLPELDL